jgi:hypothetical protein
MFTLIVDDFGVEYVGKEHAIHLRDTIKEHYDTTENWKGDLYSGINLDWNYNKCTCRLSMEDYIDTVLTKYNRTHDRRSQYFHHSKPPPSTIWSQNPVCR